MPLIARLALWSVGIGVVGCSEPAALVGNACQAAVTPTVSETAPPEFRWAPACDVGTVVVTTEAGQPMWQISSEPQADFTPTNQIHSGVTYGVLPPGTQAFIEATGLVVGQTYRVNLSVTNSQGAATHVGATTFSLRAE
jgi:hypothetical protein